MIPFIQEAALPGGIRLWLVERHALPLVHLSFVFRAGADADPAQKAGLGTLAADAIETGTPSRSLADIAEQFDFAGAYFQSSVSHDGTVFSLSTLTPHLDEMAGVIADMFRNATYPEAEVERIRKQRLTSFLQQKDRPARIASSVFYRTVYGSAHPYGIDAEGNERTLPQITREDVPEFKQHYYRPEQLLVICVGDLTMPALASLIGNALGDWSPAGPPGTISEPVLRPHAPGIQVVNRPGSVQSEVRMGSIAIRRNTPDYHTALVLNRILGGQFSSRLNANLREQRGLTYGAWSTFQAWRREGPFVAGGAFHSEKTDEALREMIGELQRMRDDGITAEEHTFAIESLAGAYALAFETSGQVALALQVRELYDLPADNFATYLEKLRAVSRDDVLRVARRFLDPTSMTTVVVGDAAQIVPLIEASSLGHVTLTAPGGEPATPPSSL
jgi:zinc protease